jgi:predicted NBD/HSP70 family sugar kinase
MATSQSVRHLNEIRALNVLLREGGLSRADLARALGLNRSSTGHIVANLLIEQLVVEKSSPSTRDGDALPGRPGIELGINPRGGTFIGAEIGVDRLNVIAIDLTAHEILRRSIEFATSLQTPGDGVRRLAQLIRSAMGGLIPKSRVRGVCVTIPALLDDDGQVRNALTLGWRNVPLSSMLREHIGPDIPILVENDANAFAVAETYRGTSQRSDVVAFLLIENGVGGGIILGGKLFRGGFGFAGEFGQIVIGDRGFFAGRQTPGHLESYIGKDAILARYRENGGGSASTLDELLLCLERGDKTAQSTASDWGSRLANGLTQLTMVLNPGLIILGGSVAPVFRYVAEEVKEAMAREFLEGYPSPKIEISAFGPEGPAFGGACLIHQRIFSIDERRISLDGIHSFPHPVG